MKRGLVVVGLLVLVLFISSCAELSPNKLQENRYFNDYEFDQPCEGPCSDQQDEVNCMVRCDDCVWDYEEDYGWSCQNDEKLTKQEVLDMLNRCTYTYVADSQTSCSEGCTSLNPSMTCVLAEKFISIEDRGLIVPCGFPYADHSLQYGGEKLRCICCTTQSGGPDLIVEDIWIETRESPTQGYNYYITVKNIGDLPAENSMLHVLISPEQPQAIDDYFGCYGESSGPVPSNNFVEGDILYPGATEIYSDYFNTVVDGEISIVATSDYYGEVVELVEDNNIYSENFEVEAAITEEDCPNLCLDGTCYD